MHGRSFGSRHMRPGVVITMLAASAVVYAADAGEWIDRINESGRVLANMNATPSLSVARETLWRALCIGVVPHVRSASFAVGASESKGVVICHSNGSTG